MTSHEAERRFPIRAEWLLVLGAALVAACGEPGGFSRGITDISSPTGQPPGGPTTGGGATGGSYSVSGVLTLRTASGTAPLANAGVGGYVITTNGTSYGLAPTSTDVDGRYQFSNVPNGVVVLTGDAPHAIQPCVAIATVDAANSVKDFELLDSAATRSETESPTLSGVVYRKTSAGKQPVAGAVIEFEYAPVPAARTITDAQGRYSLCHLPMGRGGLDVWLNGVYLGGAVIYTFGDDVLDLNF